MINTSKTILLSVSVLTWLNLFSQEDTTKHLLKEIVVSSSRTPESIISSPVSIDKLRLADLKNLAVPTFYDGIEYLRGVQVITPSLGFKVINTRGFANTTNVRFTQLVDGIDNQAPHLGAPIANALGANELDIFSVELIPGVASALYGMNAINGLANIHTKNPFMFEGVSFQQLTGVNHLGNSSSFSAQLYSTSNFRFAQAISPKFAYKINLSYTHGTDWEADNRNDLAPNINSSSSLMGDDNPAYDEVNSYGNESSNRKTLTLNGKKYVVSRTGYRETDFTNYGLDNYKGDVGIYYRPSKGHEISLTYKSALINTIYQRSNRFRLEDYQLNQIAGEYQGDIFQIRSYITLENTGKSYNLRSLAENMDRAYKSDADWYADYTAAYNDGIANGLSDVDAHKSARTVADDGRFIPGTDSWNQKQNELVNINNWDFGAALRVRSNLIHAEGLLNWDKLFPEFFKKVNTNLLSGFDYRNYVIIPDGNYFINPVDSSENLTYSKAGGFIQANTHLLKNKLKLNATLRIDKADYFNWKLNPRFALVFMPNQKFSIRTSYQSGYRFPSIFEGFSNVNSGGVKRVGGLRVMSDGIFENSYTKASIDAFQAKVNSDVNSLGITQAEAIEMNKDILQKNPYTYLNPEFVRSFEFGIRSLSLNEKLYVDADFYYNIYDNFIAQVEASIPNTTNPDSIAISLYSKSTQSRYRLWTNSKSVIYNYGASIQVRYKFADKISLTTNFSYAILDKKEDEDGLEDGFNTPAFTVNSTLATEQIWRNLGAAITARYQSSFDYVSFLVSGEVPAYWTLDAQINYGFGKSGFTLKMGASNLLNKTYYNILGGSAVGGLYYISILYEGFKRNKN